MIETIEFKTKTQETKIQPWEDHPIAAALNIDSRSPIFWPVVNCIISYLWKRNTQEVRWNYRNSYQGHYHKIH